MKRLCIFIGLVLGIAATAAGVLSYRRHAQEIARSTITTGHDSGEICFNPPGNQIAVSESAAISAYSCKAFPFPRIWTHPIRRDLRVAEMVGQGEWIGVGLFESRKQTAANVIILDSKTGQTVQEFLAHEGPVCNVAFSPDGRYLVTSGQPHGADWGTAGEVRLWRTDTWEKTAEIVDLTSPVEGLDVDPQGRFIVMDVTIDRASKVGIFDPQTLAMLRSWDAPRGLTYDLAVSNDGSLVASTYDSGIYVHQLADGKLVRHELPGGLCGRMEWLPGSAKRLVVSSKDGTFLIDLAREGTQRVYGKLRALSVDPQGRYLAIGHREGVRLLDLAELNHD